MCTRYCLTVSPEAVRCHFALREVHEFPPRYNIAPGQPVAIVRRDPDGVCRLALVRWGLLPSWVRDPGAFGALLNARAETAAERSAFRGALRHRRCLVPATGFYAWTGPRSARRPHLIRPAAGGLLAFAGLWEHWIGADGSELETMAILTVAAHGAVAGHHDRMPLVARAADYARWLDCRSGSAAAIADILAGSGPGAPHLVIKRVSHMVNDPQAEGAGPWQAADEEPA